MFRSIDRRILFDILKRNRYRSRVKRQTGLYPLESMNVFVTMRCNAKCEHCFCWQDLNIGIPELSLEHYTRLAEQFIPLELMCFTGGEPTLRKDLLEVAKAFASRGMVSTVMINTNGLKPDLLVELTERFKTEFPDHGLVFQLSIDGLEETHDRIRGVPGNYKKVIESLQKIWKLKQRFTTAFTAVALTVITDQNYRELVALNDALRAEVGNDFYQGFELLRDVERTAWNIPDEVREKGVGPKNMDLPPREAFDQIAADLTFINRRNPYRLDPFHLHNLLQLEMVKTGKPAAPCVTAGQSVGVLYANGDVAHCEFTLPFANVADFGFDFRALWHSEAANKRRSQITGCHCIHGCFHGKSVEFDPMMLARMAVKTI